MSHTQSGGRIPVSVNNVKVTSYRYPELLEKIKEAIDNGSKLKIAYANANTINLTYSITELKDTLNSFDIVHTDGIGIYFAERFLGKDKHPSYRFTGSDFYPMLARESVKNNWKLFFFGNSPETLSKIKSNYPELKISGAISGYDYNDEDVIQAVNNSGADIFVIGLGTPQQENWVLKHSGRLNCPVTICVGDGISVFAGIKRRGPKFMQKLGLEWLTRLALNPVKYFNRYVIGNPLFLYRIIILKMRKLA